MNYQKFNVGDKVRDKYGKVWEVLFQQGCQVWVGCNTWIHPSNLWRVL